MALQFKIDDVPSVNTIYRGRRYKTERYKIWRRSKQWDLYEQRVEKVSGPFELEILVAPAKRKRDLDNYLKAILDLLVEANIIQGDEYPYCMGISIKWSNALQSGVSVKINKLEG